VKSTRLLVVALVAVLCAALLAACGSEPTKADYQKQMKKASATAQGELDKLESGATSEKDVDKAQAALEQAADDVADIDPPSEVKDLHADLEDVLRDSAKQMGKIKPLLPLSKKDPKTLTPDEKKKMEDVTKGFAKVQKEMARVTAGYDKKKYKIGFNQ
jgi:hypothetical protein